ncbi:hypothetical protein HHI36_019615 [Cryptolaemus montrouzieri]|uniref:Uncharacterized protein n=1 Tax=Cryptolaemus montrouzieri TaxID=559131 RepID=A0ABD2N7Y8_9CUCU
MFSLYSNILVSVVSAYMPSTSIIPHGNDGLPQECSPYKNEYSTEIHSYTQINAIIEKMLSEVDEFDTLDDNCVNSLTLEPSSDALIEIPIKKIIGKQYTATANIFVSEENSNKEDTNEDNLESEDIQSTSDEYLDPYKYDILFGNAQGSLVEYLDEEDNANSLDDFYEPIEMRNHADNQKDIWYEGTFRNLSVVLEEDEDNSSQIETKQESISRQIYDLEALDYDSEYPSYSGALYDDTPPEYFSESSQMRSSISTDDSDNESQDNITKAEVKLLVRSQEGKLDMIEVKSIKDFLSKEDFRVKDARSSGKFAKLANRFTNIWDKRKPNYYSTLPQESVSKQTKKDKTKPSFTLPRLFMRNTEPEIISSRYLVTSENQSKGKNKIVAKPNENFPLSFNQNTFDRNVVEKKVDLYANIPFYPTYNYSYTGVAIPTTKPIQYVHPTDVTISEAYCDWSSELEASRGKTTSTQYLDKLEETLLDKNVDPSVVDFPNMKNFETNNSTNIINETNAFIQSECKVESNEDKNLEMLAKDSTDLEDSSNKSKKGFLGSLKSFIIPSSEKLDSESNKSSPKKEKKKNKNKDNSDASPAVTRKPRLPTPPESLDREVEDQIESSKKYVESAGTKNTFSLSSEVKEEISQEKIELTKEYNTIPKIDDAEAILEQPIKINEKLQTEDVKDNVSAIPTEISFSSSENVDPSETSAKKEKEDRKSNRKLFGLFGKTSKERDDSDESEIIEKQDKEISTETLEKRKKTGLLGFLTKKSKGSSEEAPEINNDLPSTREPYLEMINETNSFLLLENQHYEDNFLPSTTKVDNKKANVIEEIKSKTSSPKSFFSGLKIRQDSEADKPSYIKFDGDDYELINSVSPEKSKKVTFEKDYEDGEKKSENGIQEEPDKVVCRLLSNTSQVQPTSNQMMKEQSEIFLANERENYDSLEREEIMSDIIIKKEDSVKYKEECVPATKSKGIFSIFSKKDKKPKEEIINKNEENIQKETLATKQKLHGNDAKQKDTEAEQEKRMISFTNEFIEIEKLEHNKEKTEKIIYEEKLCPEIQISGVENTPDEDKVGPVEKEVVETIISKEENASKVLQGKNLEEDMSDIVSSEEILKDEEQNLKTNLFFLPETIIHITNEFLQSEKISGNHQDCKLIQKAVTEHQETLKKENKSKGIFKIFGKKSESPEKKKEEAAAEKRPHSELYSVPDSPSKTRKEHERSSSLERGVKPKGLFKFFSKKKDSMEAHDSDETATQEGMSKEENVKGITAAFLEKEKSLYGDDIKYTEWSDTRRTPSTKVDETAQGVSYSGKDVINKEDFVSAKPSADRRQQEEPNLNSDQPIDSNLGKNDIHSNVGLIQLTDDFLNREKDFFFDVKCSNLDKREGSTVNEPSDIQKVSTDVTEKGVTLRRKDSKSKGLFKIFKRRSQDRDIPETDTKVSENEKETIKVIQGKEALLSSKEKTSEDESKSKGIFKIFRKKTETPEDKATAGTEGDSKINVENARKETGDFLNNEKKFYHDTERKKDKDLLQLELSIDQESKEINEKSELGAEDAIKLTEDFSHLDKSSHHDAEQNKQPDETRERKEESIISKIEDKGKTQEILFNEEIYQDNEYITELAHKSKTTEIDTTDDKSVKDDAKSGKIFKIFRKKTDKVPIDITEQVIEEKKTTESQTKSKSFEEKSSKDDSKNKGIFKLLKKKTESSTQSAPTGIEETSGMTEENARQNTEEFLKMEKELYQDIEKEKNKEALHSKLVIQSKVTDGKLEDEVESKGISKIFHKKEISTDEVTKETKGKNIVSTTEEFTITTKTVLRNGTDNILENGKNETIIQSKSEVIDGDKLSENSLVGEKFVVSTNKSVFNIFRKKEESSTDLPSANIEEQTHTENDGSRDSEEFLSNEKVFYEDAEQVLNLVKPSEISEKAIQQKKRGFFDIFSKTPENVEGKRPHQIIKEDITSSKVMTEEPTDIEGIKEKEHGESTKGFLRMEKDSYDDGKLIEVKSKISKGINEIDHVSEISEEPEPLQKKKERKGIFKIFRKTTAEANEAKILPELKSKSIDETITINDKSIIKSEPEVSDERKSSESSTIHIKKDLSGISVPIATEVPKVIHRDTINDTQELLGDEQIFYDDAKHATYHLKSWEISEEAIQQKEGKLSSIFSQTPKHEGKTHLPEEGIEAKKHCEVTNDFLKMEKTLYDDGKFIETKCETKEVENKNEQVLKISEEQQQPQKKKKQKGIFRVFGKTSAEVDEPKILPESKTKSVDKIEIDSSEMKNCDEKINGEITIQSKPKLAGTGKSSDNSFTDTKKERFQIEAPTDPQERMQTEGDSKKNTEEFLSNEQIFYEDSERVVDHIEPSGTVQQKRPGLFSKFSKTPENLDEHEKDIKTSVVTTEELSHEKETNDILKMEKTSYHDGKPIEKESEISEDEYKQEQVSEILAEQQQPQKKKKHKGIFKIFRKTSSELSETEIVPEVKSKSLDKTDVIISKETMNEVGPIFCGTKTEFIEKEDSLPEVKDVEQFSSLIVKEQVIPKKSSKIERIVHIVEEESKPGNREVFQSSNVEINRKLETEQPRNKDFQDLITATTEFKEMETIFHHDREDIQLNEKVNLNESQYIIDNSKNVPTDNTKNISEEKSADSQQSKVKEIINTIVDTLTFSNTETTKEDSNEKKDESKISEIVLKDVSVVTEEKQGPLSKTSKESKEGKKLRKDQKGKGIFNIFGRKSEERELKEKSDDTKDNGITKDEKLPLSEEIRDLSKKDEKDKKLFKIFGRKEKVKPEHDVEVPRPEELSTEKLKQLSYDFLDKEKIFYHDSEYVKRSPTTIGKEEILSSDSLIGKHDNVIPEYSVFSVPPSGGLIEEGMKTSEQTISNLKGKLVEETSESKISEIVSKDDTIDGPTEEQESSLSKTRKESKAEKKSRKDHKGKGLFNIFGRKSEERELHEKSDDIKNQNDVKENKIPKDEKLPLLEENSDLPKEDKKDKKLFKIFGKREKIKPEDDSEVRRPEDVSTDKLKQLSDDFLNKEKIFYHDSEYIQHSPAIFSREEILRNESLMEKHDIVIPEYSEKAINIDKTNILEANKQKIDENIREVSTIKVIERIESSVQSSEAIFKEREKTGEQTIPQLKGKLVEETSESKIIEIIPKDETIVISTKERESPILKTSKESKEEKTSRKDHKGKVLFNIFGRKSEERELQEESDDEKENKITQDKKFTLLEDNTDLSKEDKKDKKSFKIFGKRENIKHGNDFEVQRPEHVKESPDKLKQLNDEFLNKEKIFYHDSEYVQRPSATIGKEGISESESLIEKHDNVIPKYSENANNVGKIKIIDAKEQSIDENQKVLSPIKVVEDIESSLQSSGEIIKEGIKTGEKTISQLKVKLVEETSKSKVSEVVPKDETIVISIEERENPLLKTSKESKEEKKSRKDHKGKVLFNIFGRRSEERELQEEIDDIKNENDGEENKITKLTSLKENSDLSNEDKKDRKLFKIFSKKEKIKHGNDFEVQRPEDVKESSDMLRQLSDDFLNKERIFYHDSECVHSSPATIGKEEISESESLIEKHDNVVPKYSEKDNNVVRINIIDVKEQKLDENKKVHSPMKVVESIESSEQKLASKQFRN